MNGGDAVRVAGSGSGQARLPDLQVASHGGPLAVDDGKHDGIAQAAIGQPLVLAQHAILLGTQARNGFA